MWIDVLTIVKFEIVYENRNRFLVSLKSLFIFVLGVRSQRGFLCAQQYTD